MLDLVSGVWSMSRMSSPCQRSLAKLRKEGWFCAITERWNPFAKIRQDLFGFVDVLCLRGDQVLAVQTTSGSNASKRVQKIRETQAAALWLEGYPHRQIVVHSWAKRGGRGQVKRWDCVVIPILPPEVEQQMRESAMERRS